MEGLITCGQMVLFVKCHAGTTKNGGYTTDKQVWFLVCVYKVTTLVYACKKLQLCSLSDWGTADVD